VRPLCEEAGIKLVLLDDMDMSLECALPEIDLSRRAMILFTSGTTNKPKGVVTTHKNIEAQIKTLVDFWQWQKDDVIPLFLPMHHVHGIINVLCCGLWAGATVESHENGFDIKAITDRVKAGAYSVFMAVPTIYVKLIQALEKIPQTERDAICKGFKDMRLMISGSAALPVKIHKDWQALTGQVLLERYGMTEIGMALSNPMDGERRPGAVGVPLPGVDIQLVSEEGQVVSDEGSPGEIWVKGDTVFLEYWQNKKATQTSFKDGWFVTGDMARSIAMVVVVALVGWRLCW
jgi:malonyl-CoA/methylmalonyl-CoA synthetase